MDRAHEKQRLITEKASHLEVVYKPNGEVQLTYHPDTLTWAAGLWQCCGRKSHESGCATQVICHPNKSAPQHAAPKSPLSPVPLTPVPLTPVPLTPVPLTPVPLSPVPLLPVSPLTPLLPPGYYFPFGIGG